jgi:hypothetical protein
MLPHSYELPAAVLLVLSGALSCFAGYRLFRVVLGIYGFIIGAAFASSMVAASNTVGMLVAAVLGGLAGAIILVLAYFVGIALIGAGLGALVMHLVWRQIGTGDPPWVAVIVLAILGAIGAMVLQRYVIVVSTAFAGAWMIIVGGMAIAESRAARGAPATVSADVWILYPFSPGGSELWITVAWIALGLVGTAVQLGMTGKKR